MVGSTDRQAREAGYRAKFGKEISPGLCAVLGKHFFGIDAQIPKLLAR
jgi:hypothetical protein